jgi:hypothetical protein
MLVFLGIVGAVTGAAVAIAAVEKSPDSTIDRRLAAWLVAAWTIGLLLSVPMYKAYPRLTLPLIVASWIGMGVFAEILVAEIQQSAQLPQPGTASQPQLGRRLRARQSLARARPFLLVILLGGIGVAFTQHSLWTQGIPGWQPRNGIAELAPQIRDDIVRHAGVDRSKGLDQFAIYTYGEPALCFQLRAAGCAYAKPVRDLSFASPEAAPPKIASYITFGWQAWHTQGFGEQLAQALPRLQLVGKYRYFPSKIVLLDEDDQKVKHDRPPEHEIEVYFLK